MAILMIFLENLARGLLFRIKGSTIKESLVSIASKLEQVLYLCMAKMVGVAPRTVEGPPLISCSGSPRELGAVLQLPRVCQCLQTDFPRFFHSFGVRFGVLWGLVEDGLPLGPRGR